MNPSKFISHSPDDLDIVSKALLQFAGERRVIAFFGQMGSGKTTFINRVCNVIGVKQHVSSPTFAIVNEYEAGSGEPVYHFDFYRIKNEKEAVDIGTEEYFYSGHYCFVEWPEKILNLLPKESVFVRIELENEARLITFSYG